MDDNDDKLMDHEYDGIKELDNDLPGWWVALFWLSIIYGVVYFAYYHVIFPEKTQDAAFQEEMAAAEKQMQARIAASGGTVEIKLSEEVMAHAAKGKQTFATFCAACHGNQGQGAQCPNLTDNHFLHGHDYEGITKIIADGSPTNPAMMAWKASLSPEQIEDVSTYVFTLRGKNTPGKAAEGKEVSTEQLLAAAEPTFDAQPTTAEKVGPETAPEKDTAPAKDETKETTAVDPAAIAAKAKAAYMTCAACHGVNGEGNPAMKAPALGGQNSHYLARQIANFKDGKRVSKEPMAAGMIPMLANLSPEDINALAKHMSKLQPKALAHTLKGDAAKGKQLYATCQACHGFKGEGNPVVKGPKLVGLQDWYILSQLKAFKDGHRGVDPTKEPEGATMAPMAKLLADDQAMIDIAEYLKTLSK